MPKTKKAEMEKKSAAPSDIIPLAGATSAEDGPSSSGQSRVVYIGYGGFGGVIPIAGCKH